MFSFTRLLFEFKPFGSECLTSVEFVVVAGPGGSRTVCLRGNRSIWVCGNDAISLLFLSFDCSASK